VRHGIEKHVTAYTSVIIIIIIIIIIIYCGINQYKLTEPSTTTNQTL
jgi:uncharacterized membrane protein YvbJ